MKYWITSDWHLNHRNIIKLANRPENYQELILQRHLEKIKSEDTLINLGDVIFGQKNDLKGFLEQLSCRKILVRGNHDEHNTDTFYYRSGFDFVCNSLEIDYILFSHAPMQLTDYYGFNVHGHLHANGHRNDEIGCEVSERHFLIAMELTNYYPVNLDVIKGKMK